MRWPFRRRPKDRWPEWRPDMLVTPEQRSITGYYTNPYAFRMEEALIPKEHS
ncbi:hypothetical protein SEA_ORANGE_37 [Mycobacterium phage Orange]|nr:hypothetical protein SEA_JOSELITO_38 [Mycobacterium phage Joselito]QBI97869.1 hypothetical protein SEA_ORANGE_37 [Mycobacterium phage Orange]QBI98211.1 hypothetical protein SEA_BOWTIE_38 [Mycobacterium phage Bowtie]QBI98408.1 hypothetical protein SEA_MUNCH_38 [Mycobacterium phage Munch]QGZ16453.1 hypothetical protein SEA_ANEEM_38 [Mycobacterium phage Aneem]UAW08909.1 hypothetical protein SEA_LUCIVIA_38 [Mycobacterium phage Lucivia]